MIYLPVTLLLFLLFVLIFPLIWLTIALDVVEIAVAKLGFSSNIALLLFLAVVLGIGTQKEKEIKVIGKGKFVIFVFQSSVN